MGHRTGLGGLARRDVLRAGLVGLGGGILGFGAGAVREADAAPGLGNRVLVVVELSGANDGLNTVVPITDDNYYRARPRLALRPEKPCGSTTASASIPP